MWFVVSAAVTVAAYLQLQHVRVVCHNQDSCIICSSFPLLLIRNCNQSYCCFPNRRTPLIATKCYQNVASFSEIHSEFHLHMQIAANKIINTSIECYKEIC